MSGKSLEGQSQALFNIAWEISRNFDRPAKNFQKLSYHAFYIALLCDLKKNMFYMIRSVVDMCLFAHVKST